MRGSRRAMWLLPVLLDHHSSRLRPRRGLRGAAELALDMPKESDISQMCRRFAAYLTYLALQQRTFLVQSAALSQTFGPNRVFGDPKHARLSLPISHPPGRLSLLTGRNGKDKTEPGREYQPAKPPGAKEKKASRQDKTSNGGKLVEKHTVPVGPLRRGLRRHRPRHGGDATRSVPAQPHQDRRVVWVLGSPFVYTASVMPIQALYRLYHSTVRVYMKRKHGKIGRWVRSSVKRRLHVQSLGFAEDVPHPGPGSLSAGLRRLLILLSTILHGSRPLQMEPSTV
ncbi:hypothetical protein CHU98_g3278 [Xylaria longipes]|nr:hypothetical protein CHU98_g3278 [Xylaria longipes]